MARVCFVIQHPLSSASDLDSPSGTLTIVRLLLDHWGHGDELVVLCNKDFAKLPVLRALQREVGFQIAELPAPTVQDQRARICYRGQKGAAALLSRTKIGLLAPVTTAKALRAIWAFFTSSNIEVVFSHSGGYPHANLNLLAVIAAKFARIRHNYLIVHNVPDPVFLRRLPFSFVQDRIVGRAATRMLSVSAACAQSVASERYFGVNVDYIHNGIPVTLPESVPTPEEPSWHRDGIPVLMFLGSLQRRKGLHILIDALSLVQMPCKLVVLGTGNDAYMQLLVAAIRRHGLSDRIHFLGFDPDAASQLRWADLLLLPSIAYESFGMVILEAMIHSKPVICSDFGGMKEVVNHNETGLVTPAGDAAALARAIDSMLTDPERAKAMGRAGRRRLERMFSIEASVQRYQRLYQTGDPSPGISLRQNCT